MGDGHVSFVVNNVRVFFPYEPYKTQREYIESVITALSKGHHALLESPTGTGKTLSLLCSSMAWLQSGANKKSIIYYTSRTHMQLAQAAKELKRTAYARNPAVVIGSRAQMCLNNEVKQQAGDHLINRACRNAIAKNACSYHSNYENKLEVLDVNSVNDIEDLCQFGKTHQCCPYYASKKIAETKASVIFMPYNYLFDPSLRKSVKLKLENSVIIFDEAHNIEGVLKDSVSGFFTLNCLKTTQDSCLKLPEKIHDALNREKHGLSRYGYNPDKLNGVVDEFAKQSTNSKKPDKEPKVNPIEELAEMLTNNRLQQVNRCAQLLIDNTKTILKMDATNTVDKIYHLMEKANIMYSTSDVIIKTLESMSSFWSIAGVMNPALVARYVSASTNMSQFISLLFPDDCISVVRQAEHRKRVSEFYTSHLKGIYESSVVLRKGELKDWQLDLWCLHPAIGLKRVIDSNCIRGPRSLIVTSGTLAPIGAIERELETKFNIIREFKHIIGEDQLKVMIVGTSPDQYSLVSHFEATKKDDYCKALGKTLVPLFQILPYGTLVFFQSYSLLNRVLRYWKEKSNIWRDMTAVSTIYVESQNQSGFLSDVSAYKRRLDLPNSRAVFFGVCRGKLSEGVNLVGNHCRTVMLTGLPFPSLTDPKVVSTRNFHSKKGDADGKLWYSQQMTRALNQTIGRVIRSKNDFGMLILCDPRFSSYKFSLSEWTRNFFPTESTPMCKVEVVIKDFFKHHGITITQSASEDVGAFEISLSRVSDISQVLGGSPFSEESGSRRSSLHSRQSQSQSLAGSSQASNKSQSKSDRSAAPNLSASDRQAAMVAAYKVDRATYKRVKNGRLRPVDETSGVGPTSSAKRSRTTVEIFESVCNGSNDVSNAPITVTISSSSCSSNRNSQPSQQQQQQSAPPPPPATTTGPNESQAVIDLTENYVPKPPPKSLNIFKKRTKNNNQNNKSRQVIQTQSSDATSISQHTQEYSILNQFRDNRPVSYRCYICFNSAENPHRTPCTCAHVGCLNCLRVLTRKKTCGKCGANNIKKKNLKPLLFKSAFFTNERGKLVVVPAKTNSNNKNYTR